MDFENSIGNYCICLAETEELEEGVLLLNQTIEPTPPVGFRFAPTDQELICGYLLKKVNNMLPPNDLVVDLNIYQTDPSFIQFNDRRFVQGERYFFVEREMVSKNENGKRPRRTVATGNVEVGYWHSSTAEKGITDDNNNIIGYKKSLNFFHYQDINNKDRKHAKKGDFIMHEYSLPTNKFERWVVCRIRRNQRGKTNEF